MWIEILSFGVTWNTQHGRGPRGPCGLKFHVFPHVYQFVWSRPARALWIEILYARGVRAGSITSRPARALWIEILHTSMCAHQIVGRGPRGPCGLKFHYYFQIHFLHSRGPRGPCGLKCPYVPLRPQAYAGRGPRGPCGLKYRYRRRNWHTPESRPARALWIEILLVSSFFISPIVEAREGLVD